MKKLLLGTTAIVGLSVLAAGTAMASDPPSLSMSGNVKFEAWFSDEDGEDTTNISNTGKNAGRNRGANFQVDDAEIVFKAKATADNGLEYGAKIEYEFEASATDEAMIWLSGNWGQIDMGNEDGAEDLVKKGGWSVLGAAGGWDGETNDVFGTMGVEADILGPALSGDTSDANKITYWTPKMNGFRAGLSYTPDSGQNFDDAIVDNGTTQMDNHLGLGVEYAGTFDDISVAVSGRYARAEAEDDVTFEDYGAWSVGGTVGYMGFTLGAAYTDNGDGGIAKTATANGQENGSWWDVALGYGEGPYKVAVGYFYGVAEQTTGTQDDEVSWFTVTGDYTVAPGLGVYAEYDYVDIDQNGTANDNNVQMFMVGTKVSF